MSRTVLICAAHPDDEVLGCGGTMARHAAAGDTVHVAFMADGVLSRHGAGNATAEIAARHAAARAAAATLGAETPVFFDFPDQRLDTVPLIDITQSIEQLLARIKPDTVYTHFHGDLNLDHRLVAAAVMTATRPVPGHRVAALYGFQVLSSTEWNFAATPGHFQPQRFVAIAQQMEQKLAALRHYDYEMRDFPHPRSYQAVRALAEITGTTIGTAAAEAFVVYREIVQ
jgi:N-acetylglucosamine malate deacetylase 1